MSSHVTPVRALMVTVIALFALFLAGPPASSSVRAVDRATKAEPTPAAVETAVIEPVVPASRTSLYPSFDVEGGSLDQRERLELAVSRFRGAGLALPDLVIVFASSADACNGYYGLYEHDPLKPRVTFCSQVNFVYEHELAHVWEAHSATDSQRETFMSLRGYSVWNDSDVAWNDRGIEGAAFIIQQTIGGLPLPYTLNREFWDRSTAFEALTGQRDRRLVDELHQPDLQ